MLFQYHDNIQGGEFFALNAAGQRIAEISYLWHSEHIIIANHTWVDDSLRGQGVARQLLDVLVNFCREKSLKIIASCSYVALIFQRDAQAFDDVVAMI